MQLKALNHQAIRSRALHSRCDNSHDAVRVVPDIIFGNKQMCQSRNSILTSLMSVSKIDAKKRIADIGV